MGYLIFFVILYYLIIDLFEWQDGKAFAKTYCFSKKIFYLLNKTVILPGTILVIIFVLSHLFHPVND